MGRFPRLRKTPDPCHEVSDDKARHSWIRTLPIAIGRHACPSLQSKDQKVANEAQNFDLLCFHCPSIAFPKLYSCSQCPQNCQKMPCPTSRLQVSLHRVLMCWQNHCDRFRASDRLECTQLEDWYDRSQPHQLAEESPSLHRDAPLRSDPEQDLERRFSGTFPAPPFRETFQSSEARIRDHRNLQV